MKSFGPSGPEFYFAALLVAALLSAARAADVDLSFSNACRIDESQFSSHDPKRLFYFDLDAPGPRGGPERTFTLHAEGDTRFKTWFDPKVPPSDAGDPAARSLAVQITSDVDAHKKDKIVLALVPDQSPAHLSADAAENRRYVSFDFMLDPKYEKPTAWVLHFQAWQCCGGHPPFTIEALPGADRQGPIDLTFGVRDDAAENRRDHPRTVLAGVRVKRGEWHNVVLALAPQSNASRLPGSIAAWFDGRKLFSSQRQWGYTPSVSRVRDHLVHDAFAIELGVYRQRQKTTQTIYFQNLRYGKDLAGVSSLVRTDDESSPPR